MFRGVGLRKTVEQPILNLNFAAAGALDSRFTFSRGTSGSFVGSNGLIQSASSDVARFDHNPATNTAKGLMLEEARTNLVEHSEEFNDSFFTSTRVSVSANATTAPDGTTTADTLIEDSSNNTHLVHFDASVSNNTFYSVSVFAKQASGDRRLKIVFDDENSGFAISEAIFRLDNGTVTNTSCTSATIEDFGNDWFRCIATEKATATTSSARIILNLNDSSGSSYAGDGSSGLHLWGMQLEAGKFASSYIKTTGSTLTRNADAATMGPTSSLPFVEFNTSEGTLMMEGSVSFTPSASDFHNLVRLEGSNSATDRIDLRINSTPVASTIVKTGGGNKMTSGLGAIVANQTFRLAVAYKLNNFVSASSQQLAVSTDTSGTIPTIQKLTLLPLASGYPDAVHIKRILHFARCFSSSHMQSLVGPHNV